MILPKEFFDKIEYFEHSMEIKYGTNVYDTFTIHFKSWWRRKKVIRIARIVSDFDSTTGNFTHRATTGAADLYNQLNDWATETFQEKLDSVKKKYETNNENNVIQLKQKPKDINDDDQA